MCSISQVLDKRATHSINSLQQSYQNVLETTLRLEPEISKALKELPMLDLKEILKCPFYAFEALFLVYDLTHKVFEAETEDEERQTKLGQIKHKIIYFLSFLKSHEGVLHELLQEIS
eukprot:TRINITY_DN25167_c0_g1_i1.p1 TRINITY_DN25167_c0_g1~~TRINITY_DN25167_c0_g1_i1.p1  ORF type:complete len:117 (-),score=11.71 TRINITY_DN25167_c0_g1_i1:80-430(-)